MDAPAMLFDLDDTLLDYSGGAELCWDEACTAVVTAAGIDPAPLLDAMPGSRRWFWDDPERHRRERVDMLGAWRKIVEHAMECCGLVHPDLAAAVAEDYAARRRASWKLFPDALGALERLRRRGTPLGLVTNGDVRHQRAKIEGHGLAPFFDVVVIEGEFGLGKPDPAVYRHALGALRANPSEAVMVGDHLEWDVTAPQRLGLRGIWIDRAARGLPPGNPARPDRIIHTLDELFGGPG